MVRKRDSRAELVQTMARLMRDQGYTATGRAQLLQESGVSNGSLYHHFPGGMEQLAEEALLASGQAVAEALGAALDAAPSTGDGICRFLDMAREPVGADACPGCPVAPTALESTIISARLRAAATSCFEQWEILIGERLRAEGWPDDSVAATASAALSLVEGALLLARVSNHLSHLDNAKSAVLELLVVPADEGRRGSA